MDNRQLPPTPTRKEMFWGTQHEIWQIEGNWFFAKPMEHTAAFKRGFQPKNDDVLLATYPKTGTTWLMALCYNILDAGGKEEEDILAKKNPHDVVPTLEIRFLTDRVQDMLLNPAPGRSRLLHTHFPYSFLPDKVRAMINSPGCGSNNYKLVYMARNPKDALVSRWHFVNKNLPALDLAVPLETAVEGFCNGVMPWGPFYEHAVGYWEASKQRPDRVLFLKYEELCREPKEQVKKLAEFLLAGRRETSTEDIDVEKVLWRSSLNRLKELEVNKPTEDDKGGEFRMKNSTYFRKGTVGDWKNYLTSDMAQRIDQLTQVKFHGTGLSFDDE